MAEIKGEAMKSRSPIMTVLILAICSLCWGQSVKPQCTKPPTPPPPTPTPTQPVGVTVTNTNTNNSSSNSSAVSSSSSSSSANQTQGQQQQQTANGGNANATGGNATNGGNTLVSQTSVPRQAPPAMAPPVFANACLGGFSGGASAPVGGISFGGTKADKTCQAINLAEVFLSQGNKTAAAKVLCNTKIAKESKLTLADCSAFAETLVPAPVASVVTPTPEPQQPTIILIEEPITVTPTPEQLKEIEPKVIPAPVVRQSKKPVVHKAKPCAANPIVPDSLKQPLEK
jgi:hypothetical protein